MKTTFKFIITFTLIILTFLLLFYLTSLIPSSCIEKNVQESSNILVKEGNRYKFFKYLNITNNNYTDSIMINEAYSIDNTYPIYSFLSVRKNFKKGVTLSTLPDTNGELISFSSSDKEYDPVSELFEFLDGSVTTSVEYARYWHGYLIFLRPLLLLFNISGIRVINLILFTILLVCLCYLLNKRFGKKIAIIFAISLTIMDYFFVSYSLECAPVYLISLISSIILLIRIDKIKSIYMFFFVIGIITNFIEFLTIPLISFGIPMTIYILYLEKRKEYDIKKASIILLKSLTIWSIGYICTYISKWIIFDLAFQKNLISSAFQQVIYRLSASTEFRQNSIFLAILSMTSEITLSVGITLLIIIFILKIYSKKNGYKCELIISKEKIIHSLPILIIGALPFAWQLIVRNHTILHTFVVYRLMTLSVICFFILLSRCICFKKK